MYKFIKVSLCVLLLASTTACSKGEKNDFDPMETFGCDVLNVYNTGEYIGENTLSLFEETYNVKVNYSLFASNEMMYTKLMDNSQYDVLVPSDYMIERLISEEFLQPIDKDVITNLGAVTPSIMNKDYDPGNVYSVPYFYGNVGIIYNTNNIDAADVEKLGFNVFLEEKYKGQAYMYDSERDSFMVAFKALGYSMNTEDEAEIQAAYEWLLQVDENIEPAYVTDEVIDSIINEERDLAVVYSGDAAYMTSENENLAYFLPEGGTNLWFDAMVIPANAGCPSLANEFINFMLSYDVALDNSSYVGYTSSVEEVAQFLMSSEGDYFENNAYDARVDYEFDEVFVHNEVLKQKLADLWIKVKSK